MSNPLVTYELRDSVATITMDDGKANVMSLAMLDELADAFDRAEGDKAVVVLTGRDRMFSGGYDMAMFRSSREEIVRTIRAGGELTLRILSFPLPVVVACNGHAIAQGAFLMLSADVRLGTAGQFKIGLNEVAIGMTIPIYGIEAARQRLTPASFNHATTTGTLYAPDEALVAGFLDRVVASEQLKTAAAGQARQLTQLDMGAHRATKLRVRAAAIEAMRDGIVEEFPADTTAA